MILYFVFFLAFDQDQNSGRCERRERGFRAHFAIGLIYISLRLLLFLYIDIVLYL